MKAAGICGFDVHIVDGKVAVPTPCVLGHEFAGVVAETGENVTRFQVGDRVVSDNTGYVCGKCYHCLRGDFLSCPSREGLGYFRDGGFAEYVKINREILAVDSGCLWKIPDGVSTEAAALMDPACNGYKAAVQEGDVRPGDTVVIFGIGAIGLCCIRAAKVAGAAKIVAICRHKTRGREPVAMRLGCDCILETEKTDSVQFVKALTNGEGAAVIIDAAGSNQCIKMGIDMARNGGRVILFGYDSQPFGYLLDLIINRGVSIIGHFAYNFEAWNAVFELLKAGKYNLDCLVTHRLPLSQFDKGGKPVKR